MSRPASPVATISIPLDALSGAVVAAPPALITKRNADHLGMTPGEVLDVLREMRRDPRFANEVIVRGKSFRAAPPDAIVRFLRSTPQAAVPSVSTTPSPLPPGVASLRKLGLEPCAEPAPASEPRRKRS